MMTKSGHLWAVGYDDMGRADQVRDEIINLGWNKQYLELDDVAVVVRHPDGSFTFDRKSIPGRVQRPGLQRGGIGCGPGGRRPTDRRGRWCHGGRRWLRRGLGLGWNRRRLCQASEGADEARDVRHFRLRRRRGYGRDIARDTLKTNVDLERAKLIQSTLAAPSAHPGKSEAK